MTCMCGDPLCSSCGTLQGTYPQAEETTMTTFVYVDRWIGADRDEMIELAVGLDLDGDVVSVEARDAVEDRQVGGISLARERPPQSSAG